MDAPKKNNVAAAPRVGTRQARGMDTPESQQASPRRGRCSSTAGRHPPSPGDGYPESQQASPRRGRCISTAGRHPPSPGDGYPESQQASPRRGRCSSTAGRHPPSPGDGYPESQQASPRRGRCSSTAGRHPPSPEDGYPESQLFATTGTVALVRTGGGERGAHRADALSAAPGVRTLPRPSPSNHAH